ncbi:FabD/lysophospholipase-like protein [Acephala macrosclerotiorum]|nr:FabD/lysophospholipase-like protein [Acephala macrosclerotiorum]
MEKEMYKLRLLSLDGGGVKGLTILLILQQLFRALESEAGHPIQPWECFDLIGGTSTGGLIALMLGRLHMTIDEAIVAYQELAPIIFKGSWWTQQEPLKYLGAATKHYWFKGENMERALKALLQTRELPSDEKLLEANAKCNTFVCTVSAYSTQTELLRNYRTRRIGHRDYDCTISEAARATSAAPLFFEPITLKNSKASFVDGGVRDNNPVEQVKNEAESIWPNRDIGCIVSIGSGFTPTLGFDTQKSNLQAVLKSLVDMATDADTKARVFRLSKEGRSLSKDHRYFRFSVQHGMASVDLAEFEKMPYMEAMTLPYIEDEDDRILQCAKRLCGKYELQGGFGD